MSMQAGQLADFIKWREKTQKSRDKVLEIEKLLKTYKTALRGARDEPVMILWKDRWILEEYATSNLSARDPTTIWPPPPQALHRTNEVTKTDSTISSATSSKRGQMPGKHKSTRVPEHDFEYAQGTDFGRAMLDTMSRRPVLQNISPSIVSWTFLAHQRDQEEEAENLRKLQHYDENHLQGKWKLLTNDDQSTISQYVEVMQNEQPSIGQDLDELRTHGVLRPSVMDAFMSIFAKEQGIQVLPSRMLDSIVAGDTSKANDTAKRYGLVKQAFDHHRFIIIPGQFKGNWLVYTIQTERRHIIRFSSTRHEYQSCDLVVQGWLRQYADCKLKKQFDNDSGPFDVEGALGTCLILVNTLYLRGQDVPAVDAWEDEDFCVAVRNWIILALSHGKIARYNDRIAHLGELSRKLCQ